MKHKERFDDVTEKLLPKTKGALKALIDKHKDTDKTNTRFSHRGTKTK